MQCDGKTVHELKLDNSWIRFGFRCSFGLPEYLELAKPLIIVVKPQSQAVVLKQIAFPEFLPKPIDFVVVTQ